MPKGGMHDVYYGKLMLLLYFQSRITSATLLRTELSLLPSNPLLPPIVLLNTSALLIFMTA